MRNPTETNRARWAFVLILLAATALYAAASRAGDVEYIPIGQPADGQGVYALQAPMHWEQKHVPIYLNRHQIPVTQAEAEYAIMYAAWSWSERTGRNFYYAGVTARDEKVGGIVINWKTWLDLIGEDKPWVDGYARTWFYASSGAIDRVSVSLKTEQWDRADKSCGHSTLVHEIGHAIGINGHSGSMRDVMYTSTHYCRYSLSAADVEMAPYSGGDRCFVELTPDLDLFVPEYNGEQAELVFNADEWSIEHMATSVSGGCSAVTMGASGDLIFNDVRSMDMTLTSVELESAGAERWVLRYAE